MTMAEPDDVDKLPLPKGWPAVARRAILHALSLSAPAFNLDLARWLDNPLPEARDRTETRRLRADIDLLQEELRVKDARIAATDPRRRAHYKPVDRMAILELRARRGWMQTETAKRFHLTEKTIATWMRRLDEEVERSEDAAERVVARNAVRKVQELPEPLLIGFAELRDLGPVLRPRR